MKEHEKVIEAQQHVPAKKRWYNNTWQWVKAHKKTVYIGLAGAAALFAAYEMHVLRRNTKQIRIARMESLELQQDYLHNLKLLKDNMQYKDELLQKLDTPHFKRWLSNQKRLSDIKIRKASIGPTTAPFRLKKR